MTREQMINALTDYATRNELVCQFQEDEHDMIAWSEFEMSQGNMEGVQLEQLIMVWDDGEMTSAIEFPYEFEEDRMSCIETFLDYMQGENETFNYAYIEEDQAVSVSIRYSYGEEKEENVDEEIMDILFFAPLQEMDRIFTSLIGIDRGYSVDEAIEELIEAEEKYELPEEYEKAEDNKERFGRVRYYFEHELLPHLLYSDTKQMVEYLLEDKGVVLWSVMSDACKENHFIMPYQVEQYKVHHHKVSEDCSIIRIVMPEPTIELLCFEIYFVYDSACGKGTYFTIERGARSKDRFLCAWNSEGRHLNYGTCNKDVGAIEKRIVEAVGG